MIAQLCIARLIVAVVLGKAVLFHRGLNWRRERTIRSGLCLISAPVLFCFLNGCSREVREQERGGVSGGRWLGGRGCFVGRFGVGSASFKKFKLRG